MTNKSEQGSRYAAQITLSQIIDVYIALGHNDSSVTIESLYCSLSSRICLASQYAYLQSAANEGKTLTQILEASTVGSYQSEESGEVEIDQFEHEVVETQLQEDPADFKDENEPIQESAENSTSPKLEHEAEQKFTNNKATEISSGSSDDVKGVPSIGSRSGPEENTEGHSKDEGKQDGKQSTNSVIEKEPNRFEGDHEISFDVCFKPSTCSCSVCASTTTGEAGLVSDKPDGGEIIEDLFSGDIKAPVSSVLMDANLVASENHDEQHDLENSFQESVSSRTLEAENNQLEEDIFSDDEGQIFEDGTDYFGESHHENVKESLLEGNHEGAGSEADNSDTAQLDQGIDRHDLEVNHAAPHLTLSLENGVDISTHSCEDKQDDFNAEGDDDLLNFDDDEEIQEEKEEHHPNSQSSHRADEPGTETIHKKSVLNGSVGAPSAAKLYHSQLDLPENESSSQDPAVFGGHSPLARSKEDSSAHHADEAPSTPSGGKNGSKRKALEDEDDFDLFDTATPDKKRRRPSR